MLLRRAVAILAVAIIAIATTSVPATSADEAKSPNPAAAGNAVVRIGDWSVDAGTITAEMRYLPPPLLERLHKDDNAARIFAVEWYANSLFARDAERSGLYGRKPGIREAAETAGRGVIAEDYIEDLIERKYAPTDTELRQFYELHKDRLCKQPTRYRIARMGVLLGKRASPEEVASAERRMAEMEKRLVAGEPFGKVADELSDFGGKLPGGELGWVTQEEIGSAEGSEEITKLAAGERTGVVTSRQGRAIYTMLERTEASTMPFEECRKLLGAALIDQFKREIKMRRIDELAKEMSASMNIDAFIGAVRAVPVPKDWEQNWHPAGP